MIIYTLEGEPATHRACSYSYCTCTETCEGLKGFDSKGLKVKL